MKLYVFLNFKTILELIANKYTNNLSVKTKYYQFN